MKIKILELKPGEQITFKNDDQIGDPLLVICIEKIATQQRATEIVEYFCDIGRKTSGNSGHKPSWEKEDGFVAQIYFPLSVKK